MRYFATAIEGIGPLLAEELAGKGAVLRDPKVEFDGRNDVVAFEATSLENLLMLRLSEDVFVEAGTAHAGDDLHRVVARSLGGRGLEQALSIYTNTVRPLHSRMRYRVIARLLAETGFLRTELRNALIKEIGVRRPRWHLDDPAELEIWCMQTQPKQFRLGIRLTDSAMRHRASRVVEREGALRPTVAAVTNTVVGHEDNAMAIQSGVSGCA